MVQLRHKNKKVVLLSQYTQKHSDNHSTNFPRGNLYLEPLKDCHRLTTSQTLLTTLIKTMPRALALLASSIHVFSLLQQIFWEVCFDELANSFESPFNMLKSKCCTVFYGYFLIVRFKSWGQ